MAMVQTDLKTVSNVSFPQKRKPVILWILKIETVLLSLLIIGITNGRLNNGLPLWGRDAPFPHIFKKQYPRII